MITMLLGGLWHGASWNFVVWGGLHGVALIVHKLYKANISDKILLGNISLKLYNTVSWVGTMIFVCVTWVFFRAQTFGDSWQVIKNMFLFKKSVGYSVPLGFLLLLLCSVKLVSRLPSFAVFFFFLSFCKPFFSIPLGRWSADFQPWQVPSGMLAPFYDAWTVFPP